MPHFRRNEDVSLYYEVKGKGDKHIVMIMGFAGTCRLFDSTVTELIPEGEEDQSPYSILLFDNRCCGQSTGDLTRQTTTMLAQDTIALANHVFGDTGTIHLYGVSLGGMIAQEAAVLLLRQKRLGSLYLGVTARYRYKVRVAMPAVLYGLMFSPLATLSKEKLVEETLKMSYSDAILDEVDETTGKKHRELLYEEQLQSWDKNMSFKLKTIAAQSPAAGTHYLSDEKLHMLRDSNVRIVCHVASEDKAMPSPLQEELAALLQAEVERTEGGHMSGGLPQNKTRLINRWKDLLANPLKSTTSTTTTSKSEQSTTEAST